MNSDRIDRALNVLLCLSQHPDGRTLKHLSEDLKLPMSSTHDLLQAMVEIDAIRATGSRTYALGKKAITLSLTIVDSLSLRNIARQYLATLSGEIGENVYLGVRTGDTVYYVDRFEASQALSVVMQLGSERPLHASSVGKLIAAYNPDLEQKVLSASTLYPYTQFTKTNRAELRAEYASIRQRGFSMSDGESVEGIVGLSAPIWDHTGTTIAAVHVSAPRGRLAEDRRPFIIDQLRQAGIAISVQLGADPKELASSSSALAAVD